MISTQELKFINIVPPAVKISSGSAVVNSYVDTRGYAYATWLIQFGALGADTADIEIEECETSGGSYVDISGADTLVARTATDANGLFAIFIPINGTRMRYQKPVLTAGAADTYISAVCILSEAGTSPFDATTRGLKGQIIL